MALSGSCIGASCAKRSLSQWRTSWGDADSDTLFDLPILRDRSRDLIRNAPLATGAINTVCTNVVGTGLILQSRIDRETLGMDEVEAVCLLKSFKEPLIYSFFCHSEHIRGVYPERNERAQCKLREESVSFFY
ncbi:MAG: phage portal protein [Deltaproteobacteria bacterium]|nr:phage portal protein [Deltaproteobacteria bacterium]